ncbi:hypothetical protein ANN_21035 [Periplaneta americana]|uniref:Uncharacterized protein n=1 Tax=Periplaneta americana TaxID=6978 RepID=A0ABQ8SE94_PERAM|nr:hypothetical protein ANN_21035 [Periplaneta americana]
MSRSGDAVSTSQLSSFDEIRDSEVLFWQYDFEDLPWDYLTLTSEKIPPGNGFLFSMMSSEWGCNATVLPSRVRLRLTVAILAVVLFKVLPILTWNRNELPKEKKKKKKKKEKKKKTKTEMMMMMMMMMKGVCLLKNGFYRTGCSLPLSHKPVIGPYPDESLSFPTVQNNRRVNQALPEMDFDKFTLQELLEEQEQRRYGLQNIEVTIVDTSVTNHLDPNHTLLLLLLLLLMMMMMMVDSGPDRISVIMPNIQPVVTRFSRWDYVTVVSAIIAILVLSLWRRDSNIMDSYRVTTVDVTESSIASGAKGPWQQQRCYSVHCHEE